MFDSRTRLSYQILGAMKGSENLGPLIFGTVIRKNVRLAEAPGTRRSIFRSASKSFGADDYTSLAVEVAERCGMPIPEDHNAIIAPEAPESELTEALESASGTDSGGMQS
jgi:hypothetical protein